MRLLPTPWCGGWGWLLAFGWATAQAASAPTFQVYSERMNEPESGDYLVQHVRTDEQGFRFIAPTGWEVRPEGTNTALLLTAPDLSAGIRIVLGRDTNTASALADAGPYRDQVLARIAGSRVVQEFRCYADGRQGVAFDLVRESQHSTQAVFRVALVPYPGGLAEFELRTSTNHFRAARASFGLLLDTFRVEAKSPGR